MPRILAIRGGAIGDFVLTLPALALLRQAFPAAELEIIGYRHIIALAEGRGYATASRSIEYAPMSGFFSKGGVLDSGLSDYFAGFQQVISWLYDPDGIFEENLRRAGVKNYLHANPIVGDHDHAAKQLARPLEKLALYLEDPAARLYPTESDRQEAVRILARQGLAPGFVLVHPGSGSPRKTWPADLWAGMLSAIDDFSIRGTLIIGGESDIEAIATLKSHLAGKAGIRFATDLTLPQIAALAACAGRFLGHDSGISHVAAAAGAPCLLLFGPTDPGVWAPQNENVTVLKAPGGVLSELELDSVIESAKTFLGEG